MQQRALTRAGGADDRNELPAVELEADLVEGAHCLTADLVLAHHVAQFDGQFGHRSLPGVGISAAYAGWSPHLRERACLLANTPHFASSLRTLDGSERSERASAMSLAPLSTPGSRRRASIQGAVTGANEATNRAFWSVAGMMRGLVSWYRLPR